MEGANKVPPDGKFSEVPGVVPTPIQLEEEQGTAGVHAGTTRVDRLLKERIRRNRSHQLFDYDEASYDGPLDFVNGDGSASERLVVVANRLPVTCSKDQHGHWQLQVSAGGLVSALKGVSTYTTMWIGWPGIWVKPGRERDALTAMLVQEGCIPVWIDPTLLDMYYNGFCNSVLWQLFHYVPLNIDSWQKMSEHRAMQMQWQAYQVANQRFADVVLENYLPNDIMWIQDYHLMVLPSLLKAVVPKMKVGFFLHTPFPSSEMYRTLPVREEVLRAVLGADLIGFHTYDYARHFISSCTRILGLEGTPEGVENNGTICRVGTFPIGIDPERFTHALETDEVQSHVAKLLNRYAGRKIMLGVDRLDMVKGIPQKLLAFEKFLEEHPEWRDKVLLVQIAVPSRTDVSEYQKLRSMVHEIVGRINGQFGTLTYVPIYHLDTSLSFTELCALYAVTDVALVTSLRDGMNLVSYEYVACQSDNAGVLVLSEFAGAAQSLGAGAILVNPWNITDMAQAIEDSLCMSEEERRERHRQNYMHVQTHTAQHWADTFISELNDTHIEADLRMKHAPPPLNMQEVVQAYKNSGKRLIVLGYNATLTTNTDAPIGRVGGLGTKRTYQEQLGKSQAKVNPKILASLQELSRDPNNVLVIFSGSETHKLEEIFGDLPVWLAAENGVFVRPPPQHLTPTQQSKRPWRALFHGISKEWMESVQLVFDYFCERTPRSSVEVRETSLVWNYKYADVEFGRIQARDLLQHLWTGPISNAPVEIIQGGKSVEVRPVSVTKGMSTQRMVGLMAEVYGINGVTFDFVLCIGHLLGRDENMYSFFEGVRVEGAAATGANGDGRKGSTGAHVLPAATQAQQLLQALHKQHQHYYHHLPPNLQPPGASNGSNTSRAPASPLPPTGNHTPTHSPSHSAIPQGAYAAVPVTSHSATPPVVCAAGPTAGPTAGPAAIPQPGVQQPGVRVGSPCGAATAAPSGSKAPQRAHLQQGQLQVELGQQQQQQLQEQHQQQQQQQHQKQQQQQQLQGPHRGCAELSHPTPVHASRPLSIPAHLPPAGPPSPSTGSTTAVTLAPNSQPCTLSTANVEGHRAAEALLDQDSLRACSASAPPHRDGHLLPRQPGVSEPGVSSSHSFHGRTRKSWGGAQDWDSRRDCPSTPASTDSGHVFRRDSKQPYEQELPDCFPPRFLFTCTVGRNRSKARFALSAASEVSDLLDSIVQQAIYHQQPPTLPPHPGGMEGLSPGSHYAQGNMDPNSRIQSFSSTEPLSPDSMFTLINSWKNFRTAGTGTTTPMAAGVDCPMPPSAIPPLAAGNNGTHSSNPAHLNNGPTNPADTTSMLGPEQPQVALPPSSMHSHASGAVVNSWALGAAAASNSQLQQQQLAGLQVQQQLLRQQREQGATSQECPPALPSGWHLPSPASAPSPTSFSVGQQPDYLQQLALLGGSNARLSDGSVSMSAGVQGNSSAQLQQQQQLEAGGSTTPASCTVPVHTQPKQQRSQSIPLASQPSPPQQPPLKAALSTTQLLLPVTANGVGSPQVPQPSPRAHSPHSPHAHHHHHVPLHAHQQPYQPPLPTHHEQVPSNYPVAAPKLSKDPPQLPTTLSPTQPHTSPTRTYHPHHHHHHHHHHHRHQHLDTPLPHPLPHTAQLPLNGCSSECTALDPHHVPTHPNHLIPHFPGADPQALLSSHPSPSKPPLTHPNFSSTPLHQGSSTPDFQQLLRSQLGPVAGGPGQQHQQYRGSSSCPIPTSLNQEPTLPTLAPTHTQHGPICAPPPLPAVVEQAASTTLYCPKPTGRTPSPISSVMTTPPDATPTSSSQQDPNLSAATLPSTSGPNSGNGPLQEEDSANPAPGPDDALVLLRNLAKAHLGSASRSSDNILQGGRPRSVQGSSSFSRQSTGSTVDPPVSGKPLAPRSGRSSSGRMSRVTSGAGLDGMALHSSVLEQLSAGNSPRAGQLSASLGGGLLTQPPPLPYIPPQPTLIQPQRQQQQQMQQLQQQTDGSGLQHSPPAPGTSMHSAGGGSTSKPHFLLDELGGCNLADEGLGQSPGSEGDIGYTSQGSLVAGYKTLDALDLMRESSNGN